MTTLTHRKNDPGIPSHGKLKLVEIGHKVKFKT